MGEKVTKVGAPKTYLELCAMENLGGKIQFMIWSGRLIPWALLHDLFLIFDFWFLDFYGKKHDYVTLWSSFSKKNHGGKKKNEQKKLKTKFRRLSLIRTRVARLYTYICIPKITILV
jgi:hypothetical protein